MHLCPGKFVVCWVNAKDLRGDWETRQESAAELSALARELYLPEAGGALRTAFGRHVRVNAIILCERFYSLHMCKGSGGINASA